MHDYQWANGPLRHDWAPTIGALHFSEPINESFFYATPVRFVYY